VPSPLWQGGRALPSCFYNEVDNLSLKKGITVLDMIPVDEAVSLFVGANQLYNGKKHLSTAMRQILFLQH